jgi:phosphoglycerate kinase
MKLRVDEIDVLNKTVFLRVDFNVPLKEGIIQDDTRIVKALKTIKYLMEKGAKLIIASHLGRPKGEVKPEFSLKPVADKLSELINKKVIFPGKVIGEEVDSIKKNFESGDILLLENTRYMPGETKNEESLSKELAKGVDIYVNDAFGASHRAHASVVGVASFVKIAAMGFLISKELEYLSMATESPKKPYIAILGGAKVKDKIPVMENLLDKVDAILVGGGMAYTFLKAKGYEIGKSLFDSEHFEKAKEIMKKAEEKGVEILFPIDHLCVKEIKENAETIVFDDNIGNDYIGVDIGEKTIEKYIRKIKSAKLIVWNGPMGVFEISEFSKGTFEIAKTVAESEGISIIGGGDSVSAVKKSGVADKITHISTGGGASLEFLSGKSLPGIECLSDKEG